MVILLLIKEQKWRHSKMGTKGEMIRMKGLQLENILEGIKNLKLESKYSKTKLEKVTTLIKH